MIYLIRQGQTDWNLFKRFNGTTETFINQNGIIQAEKQSECLKNVNFHVCFCSPQKRAIQTCEILYKGKNILIVTHAANARVIDYYFHNKPKDYDFRKAVGRNGEIVTYENE